MKEGPRRVRKEVLPSAAAINQLSRRESNSTEAETCTPGMVQTADLGTMRIMSDVIPGNGRQGESTWEGKSASKRKEPLL